MLYIYILYIYIIYYILYIYYVLYVYAVMTSHENIALPVIIIMVLWQLMYLGT